jgi:hypothetical protein
MPSFQCRVRAKGSVSEEQLAEFREAMSLAARDVAVTGGPDQPGWSATWTVEGTDAAEAGVAAFWILHAAVGTSLTADGTESFWNMPGLPINRPGLPPKHLMTLVPLAPSV